MFHLSLHCFGNSSFKHIEVFSTPDMETQCLQKGTKLGFVLSCRCSLTELWLTSTSVEKNSLQLFLYQNFLAADSAYHSLGSFVYFAGKWTSGAVLKLEIELKWSAFDVINECRIKEQYMIIRKCAPVLKFHPYKATDDEPSVKSAVFIMVFGVVSGSCWYGYVKTRLNRAPSIKWQNKW